VSRPSTGRELRRVQVRITGVAIVTLLLVLGAAGVGLLKLFEREVVRQADTHLRSAAAYITEAADADTEFPRGTGDAQIDDYVQVIDPDGVVVFASRPLEGEPAIWAPGGPVMQPGTVDTASSGELRSITTRFRSNWLVLADPLDAVDEDVRSLRNAMLIGLPVLALALGTLIWVVVGRTLRPVAAGLEREERLIADVGHELRSPLAGVRVLLETEPEDAGGRRSNRAAVLATLGRLEAIADRLLVLSRDGRGPGAAPGPVDLDEVLLRQVEMVVPQASVRIDTSGVVAGQVRGREQELESLAANLLTNAVRHARTVVELTLVEHGGAVELVVDDDGPGIAPEDRDRVFERFTRLDDGRSRDTGGAGLGLAIARTVVEDHEGSIAVLASPLGGARFVVHLPASTRGDSAPERQPTNGPVPSGGISEG